MSARALYSTTSSLVLIGLASFFLWQFEFKTGKSPVHPVHLTAGQAQAAYILPLAEANYFPIRSFNLLDPEVTAKAAGVYDVNSGKFLFAKNIDQRLPIASIAKLMTAVVVVENLPLTQGYLVAAEDINVDGTGADLYRGEAIRGADLLKIMLIKSSNDAALALASNAHRLSINLVAKMNEKARALGMDDTKFSDPAGLDDNDAYSTVNDLVKLTRYVGKYPVIWEILTNRSSDVSSLDGKLNHHLINTNRLLDEMPEIIGGKTGYTDGALETMVLEISHNSGHERLVSVVLGSQARFAETQQLLDWARSAYRWK